MDDHGCQTKLEPEARKPKSLTINFSIPFDRPEPALPEAANFVDEHVFRKLKTYSPVDVCWTIYDAIGVDPRNNLTTPDGRPISILDEGEAMHELYS